MKDIFIYGAGGHAKVTIDLLEKTKEYNIKGLLDDNTEKHGTTCVGYKVLGGIEVLEKNNSESCKIAIGIAKPKLRRELFEKIIKKGFSVVTLIHPTAYVANKKCIAEGAMVMAHAIVNIEATIGKGTVINTGAIIEHDCKIGEFVHIGPGVHLAGKVTVNNNAFVGLGSCIIEFREIGESSIIGAGSIVTKDVLPNTIVVGNPAKILEKK